MFDSSHPDSRRHRPVAAGGGAGLPSGRPSSAQPDLQRVSDDPQRIGTVLHTLGDERKGRRVRDAPTALIPDRSTLSIGPADGYDPAGYLDQLFPAGWHHSEQYANNRIEADHGQLKRRLRPMRHLRNDGTATVIIAGHALVQNMRRGHYHLTSGLPVKLRLAAAFDELSYAI